MNKCETCKWWFLPKDDYCGQEMMRPYDPDTFEPMKLGFEIRPCQNPRLLFCEAPTEINQAALADGSTYYAKLYTAPQFGCTDWTQKENV